MARQVQTRRVGSVRGKKAVAKIAAPIDTIKVEQSEQVNVSQTSSRRVSRRGAPSQSVAMEIKVEEEVKVTRGRRRMSLSPLYTNRLATRTASQVLKGKYVAESESDDEPTTPSVADNS